VLTIGVDRAITAMVAGMRSIAVYFMEDAKTVLTSSRSFWESSFAKAGKSTVAIGVVKNARSTAKLMAAP